MKKRTKEENAAHSKMMRERKRTSVSPIISPVPPTVPPCLECKKLRAKITLLEAERNARMVYRKPDDSGVPDERLGPLPKYKPLGNSYKPNSLYGA
jgi:hypothetical protein